MVNPNPEQKVDSKESSFYSLFTGIDGKAVVAEFVATTLFVYIGCGVAVSTQAFLAFHPNSGLDNTFILAVAIAFGFAITVLVFTVAPISGGHINPAVSLALYLVNNITLPKFVFYVLAQCCGAILGASMVWGTMASPQLMTQQNGSMAPPFLLGSNFVNGSIPLASAFLGETMGTFVLVWTVLMTAISKNSIAANLAPIAIGWSIILAHLLLIPITGCGINPARSLGPHLVSIMAGETIGVRGWWVYYTAPFVGSAVAAMLCKYIFGVTNEAIDEDTEKDIEAAGDRGAKVAPTDLADRFFNHRG